LELYASPYCGGDIGLKRILDRIGRDNIFPDDFIIANDPFIVALGHVPDWSFVRPIFYENELVFYHFFKTHQYDTGGAHMERIIQAYSIAMQRDCYSTLKLIEKGRIDEKVYSLILNNVRGAAMYEPIICSYTLQ